MRYVFPTRCRQWARRWGLLLACGLAAPTLATAQPTPPTWRWARNTGSTVMGQTTARHTATSPQGDVFVLGTLTGRVTFGSASFQPVIGPYPASGGDVFLAKYDSAGQLQWARQIGGTNEDRPAALATDALGNVYVGVDFASARVTLGTETLINAGGDSVQGYGEFTDVLIAKADAAGQWLWARKVGGHDSDGCGGLAVDGVGNVYVAGRLADSDSVGGFSVVGETFVARLSSTGQWQWATGGGAAQGAGGAYALALDPAGAAVFVGGSFMNTGSFGATTLTATPNGTSYRYDGYVAALAAASGQWQWARRIGGDDYEEVTALGTDASGALVAAGTFYGNEVVFDTTTYTSQVNFNQNPYGNNSFVAALSGTGNWLWSNLAGSTDESTITALAVAPLGGVYVTGIGSVSATFGPSSLSWQGGSNNAYLARADGATGAWLWAVKLNERHACGCGHLVTQYAGVAADAHGGLRVTSTYTDSARIGNIPLVGPLFFSNGSGQQQGYVAGFSDQLPLILRLSAPAGPVGSTLTLTGQRLGSATQVRFNNLPATFTVVSPTQINVTVPAGATTGFVRVTTPTGTVNSPIRFRVGPTGLAEDGARAFSLYPNPAVGTVRLTLARPGKGADVRILDGLGRTVRWQPLVAGETSVTLAVTGLPAGLYTVRVGDAVRKLLVQ